MTNKIKQYTNLEIKRLNNAEAEITLDILGDFLETYRSKVIKDLQETVSIDGFRKGYAPEKLLLDKVGGEMTILYETAEYAIREVYTSVVMDNKLDVLGKPDISIVKIAPKSDVSIKIKVVVMPEIKLPDYKTIAKEENAKPKEEIVVSEKDLESVILEFRKSRVDHSTHSHDENTTEEEHNKQIEANLPEFNLDFVKSFGNFESIEDFKVKIKENLRKEKEHKIKEKNRISIIEKAVKEITEEMPKIVVEAEMARMFDQFKHDIEKIGGKWEEYLKIIKKTEEDLRKEWMPDAIKRAKMMVLMREIAKKEDLFAKSEEVLREVAHIVEHYKDADEAGVRSYVEGTLTQENVMKFLESVA